MEKKCDKTRIVGVVVRAFNMRDFILQYHLVTDRNCSYTGVFDTADATFVKVT